VEDSSKDFMSFEWQIALDLQRKEQVEKKKAVAGYPVLGFGVHLALNFPILYKSCPLLHVWVAP
jgi:hypothetical protein